jgi:fructose-bisphosphate aldolase class I
VNIEQYERIRTGRGFIAALDQSGGSTPKALQLYGLTEVDYSNETEMFDLVHQMRSRIMTSPVFTSQRILAVILFEMTMKRTVEGLPSAQYLWRHKGIVPFLKIDDGLREEVNGALLMKPIHELELKLQAAIKNEVFGTKMRSVIKLANATGIGACVTQQFEIANKVMKADLVPIIEPEVDIHSSEKSWIEYILKRSVIENLNALDSTQNVILKLTLPDVANYYSDLVDHPRVLRVAALSGGYSRTKATELLAQNMGVIASFSRALTEGLNAKQSDVEFDRVLDESIQKIYQASIAKGELKPT